MTRFRPSVRLSASHSRLAEYPASSFPAQCAGDAQGERALFLGSADGLVPAPAAEAIHPSAVAMERQATLIERQMSGDAQSQSGSVRLTTSGDFVTHFLVPHLPELLARHPRLQLELVVADRFLDLTAGDADIAVRFTRQGRGMPLGPSESPDGVVGRLLTPLATALVASKSYIERRGRPEPGAPLDGHDVILQTGAQSLPGMAHLAGRSERAHVGLT